MLFASMLLALGNAVHPVPPNHRAPSPHDLIAAAVTAAGGIDALRAVHAYRAQTQEQLYNIGQEEWPGAPAPLLVDQYATVVIDHNRDGVWESFQRFKLGGGSATSAWMVTGDFGTLITSAGYIKIPRPGLPVSTAETLRHAYRFGFPDRILVDAYDAPVTALRPLPPRVINGRPTSGVAVALAQEALQLWFADDNHRLVAVSYVGTDLQRGKLSPVETRYSYANWTRMDNVSFPWTTVMTVDGAVAWVQTTVTAAINPSGIDTLFNVDSLPHLTPIPVTQRPVAGVNMVAAGIYRLQGLTHVPLAVQQGDSIILLEAPASPEFMHSVFDSLRARFPTTPVRAFVVTHFHSDHIAGVPTAFDAGLPAIAPVEIADFVRQLGLAPGQRAAKPRRVTPVRDSMTIGTGPSRFILYHVPTAHVAALLMAYFPEPKLLFDIDLAAGPAEDRQALYDFLRSHHLEVANLSRIHGPVMPWEAFIKTVPDTASRGAR